MSLVFNLLSSRKWPALKVGLFGIVILSFFGAALVSADTISLTFKSKTDLPVGSVVAINKDDNSTVELVPGGKTDRIYGVVINASDSVTSIQLKNRGVVVANGGIYSVLVNTQRGAIAAGNYLTISSTDGVATKAIDSDNYVLGKAQENFDGTETKAQLVGGIPQALIKVQLEPGKNPLINNGGLVPGAVRRLSESIAGRPLSAFKIYLVMAIFLITMTVSFLLIWVGVRSGILSIGRNPLSRHSIMQSLSQVIISSLVVFFGGLVGVYLLLRL